MVNRTKVRIDSFMMRYMFTVTAIVGTNGSPGVMNIKVFLKEERKLLLYCIWDKLELWRELLRVTKELEERKLGLYNYLIILGDS